MCGLLLSGCGQKSQGEDKKDEPTPVEPSGEDTPSGGDSGGEQGGEDTPTTTKYTISFNANGGSGSMSSVSMEAGEYTLPSCTFTAPSGKEFKCWKVNGEIMSVGDKITISSNITITAVWKYLDITTKAINNMPEGFILGMDASAVPSLEKSGVKYYNENDEEEDVYKILADHGVNYIRVRIWNDPYDKDGHGYGGGNCDLNNAVAIGKRATQYGMKLLVDFHYSDFWADPAKQTAPKAWASYTLEQKKEALYNFTKSSLQTLKDNKIDVGMVQVGNETNQVKMAGETDRASVGQLMNQGSKAIREVFPNALVAVHFTEPQRSGNFMINMASYMKQFSVDYDVFGTSYYPYWHGTLDNLSTVLSTIATTYNKKVMVMETSYAYTNTDTDGTGNTSPKGSDVTPHEISIQGQYDQVYDVINTIVNDTTNGIGVCYWEGTWISINKGSWTANEPYWTQYGSGWASKYAYTYDSDARSDGYSEGTAVDNQAFFDQYGKVLPSLDIFNQEKQPSGGQTDPEQTYTLNIILNLETVPTNSVFIIYDKNRSVNDDWINNKGLDWLQMTNTSEGVYTYTITDLKEGDEIRFQFATWGDGNFFLSGSSDWKPASVIMEAANKNITCSATGFPSSTSDNVVFTVS